MIKQFNPAYEKYFRCKMRKCGGVCAYNLQEISQTGPVTVTCPQCDKMWSVCVNRGKRVCCGKMVVKFTSVEKNAAIKPLVYNETVRK